MKQINFDLDKIMETIPLGRIVYDFQARKPETFNELYYKIGAYAGWLDLQIEQIMLNNFKTTPDGMSCFGSRQVNYYRANGTTLAIHCTQERENPHVKAYWIEMDENDRLYDLIIKFKDNLEKGQAPEINDPAEIKKRLFGEMLR